MSWPERVEIIAAINAILAWSAAMIHGWAATHTSGWLRRMFLAISTLALFYSFAYWWLFFNPTEGAVWSDVLRPIGLVTWVIAWAIEPIILIKYLERRGQEIVVLAEEAAEKAKERLDE